MIPSTSRPASLYTPLFRCASRRFSSAVRSCLLRKSSDIDRTELDATVQLRSRASTYPTTSCRVSFLNLECSRRFVHVANARRPASGSDRKPRKVRCPRGVCALDGCEKFSSSIITHDPAVGSSQQRPSHLPKALANIGLTTWKKRRMSRRGGGARGNV